MVRIRVSIHNQLGKIMAVDLESCRRRSDRGDFKSRALMRDRVAQLMRYPFAILRISPRLSKKPTRRPLVLKEYYAEVLEFAV
jgi:hypothetical protein